MPCFATKNKCNQAFNRIHYTIPKIKSQLFSCKSAHETYRNSHIVTIENLRKIVYNIKYKNGRIHRPHSVCLIATAAATAVIVAEKSAEAVVTAQEDYNKNNEQNIIASGIAATAVV